MALFDLEGDVVHGDSAGVSLGQTFHFDHIEEFQTRQAVDSKFHHTDGGEGLSNGARLKQGPGARGRGQERLVLRESGLDFDFRGA